MALNRRERRRQGRTGEAADGGAQQRLALLRQQAGLHYQQGRLAETLAVLRQMLAIAPRDAGTLGFAGLIAHRLGQRSQALSYLNAQRKALDADPASVEAYRGLGGLLSELGAHREAAAALGHAAGLWPQDDGLLTQQAEALKQAGRLEDAAGVARRAAALNPGSGEAWYQMGLAAQMLGQHEDAASAYRKALEIMPQDRVTLHNLGVALLATQRPGEAHELCERWLAHSPADIEALAMKGHVLQELGRTEEAAYLFDFDNYVRGHTVRPPDGYASLAEFNNALEAHVLSHPDLHVPDEADPRYHHPSLSLAFHLLEGETGPVGALERLMHEAVEDYLVNLPDDPNHPFVRCRPAKYVISAWAAVLNGQGNLDPHVHKDGYLSGCYYLRIPEEITSDENGRDGDIQGAFEVGRPPHEFGCRVAHMTRQFRPHEGFMLLFPAFLYHCTIPFKSAKRRICIAYDVIPA